MGYCDRARPTLGNSVLRLYHVSFQLWLCSYITSFTFSIYVHEFVINIITVTNTSSEILISCVLLLNPSETTRECYTVKRSQSYFASDMDRYLGFCNLWCRLPSGTSHGSTSTSAAVSRRQVLRFALASASPLLLQSFHAVEAKAENSPLAAVDGFMKKSFAQAMNVGMVDYEESMVARKKILFALIKATDTVVDIGIGTGPNLNFMPKGTQVIGVEPNEYMWPYAISKAEKLGVSLKMANGVCENLPLNDCSCDFVVTTLTLCSVRDLGKCCREIQRVLKPGGLHLFIEHVVAEPSRPLLRSAQNVLNPLQELLADGCHLNRDTGATLQSYIGDGFSEVNVERFDMLFGTLEDWISPIRPHVIGFARKTNE